MFSNFYCFRTANDECCFNIEKAQNLKFVIANIHFSIDEFRNKSKHFIIQSIQQSYKNYFCLNICSKYDFVKTT